MLALDLRTIFPVASTVNIVLCCALVLYWRTQKTFPGFGAWVLANFSLALVYVLYMLRGVAPDFWSIVVANTLACVAAVLRYGKRHPSPVSPYHKQPTTVLPCYT